MPAAIACPGCGTDGTDAANNCIAQTLVTWAAEVPATGGTIHLRAVQAPAPATAQAGRPGVGGARFGQVDRPQAENEARAKISWGDSPEKVVQYLRLQNWTQAEAIALVDELFNERAATIRRNGIAKAGVGVALMCVPVVAFFVFLGMGYFPLKVFAVTVMVGLVGVYMVVKGVIMFLAPRSEGGDVAEQ
jgi:hypothetical protein